MGRIGMGTSAGKSRHFHPEPGGYHGLGGERVPTQGSVEVRQLGKQ